MIEVANDAIAGDITVSDIPSVGLGTLSGAQSTEYSSSSPEADSPQELGERESLAVSEDEITAVKSEGEEGADDLGGYWTDHNTLMEEEKGKEDLALSEEQITAVGDAFGVVEQDTVDYWERYLTNLEDATTADLDAQTEWLDEKIDEFDTKLPIIADLFISLIDLVVLASEEMWGPKSALVQAFQAYRESLKSLIESTLQARAILMSK